MRKLLLTTAAVAAAIGLAVAAETEYGTFTDERDGKIYRTVKMPDGKTWMAYNLNYKTGNSWCFLNDVSKCKRYGRLYDWNTAMKACPEGWRLPSRGDWNDLNNAIGKSGGGKKLKARIHWDRYKDRNGHGTDNYGFSALHGGSRHPDGDFNCADDDTEEGNWWTSTKDGDSNAYFWLLIDYAAVLGEGSNDKRFGFSVRCVQNK
jgi:uncharacterized protein (TIGR02145 family)